MTHRVFFPVFLSGILTIGLLSCNSHKRSSDSCPPCPNNTRCKHEDCGCGDHEFDMGSWCLRKADDLFVGASLGTHCIEATGLYLMDIPQLGTGSGVTNAHYSIIGSGNCQTSNLGNCTFTSQPDGDEIALSGIPMTSLSDGSHICQINDSIFCMADLRGKFHGPDTIQAQIIWHGCSNGSSEPVSYTETDHLIFVRKK